MNINTCEHCEPIRRANKNLNIKLKEWEKLELDHTAMKHRLEQSTRRISRLEEDLKRKHNTVEVWYKDTKFMHKVMIKDVTQTEEGIFIEIYPTKSQEQI